MVLLLYGKEIFLYLTFSCVVERMLVKNLVLFFAVNVLDM